MKNFFPSLVFTQGRCLIKGQDDVCSVSFLRTGGKSYDTVAVVVSKYALLKKNPLLPFTGPKQSLCCSGLVYEGTDRQVLTVCGSFPSASSPPVLCDLPMNHIRGLQTAQQAPTGELMMFSPLWSHSSLSKLLTIYLDVIIVCNIIKEENLHLCRPAYLKL